MFLWGWGGVRDIGLFFFKGYWDICVFFYFGIWDIREFWDIILFWDTQLYRMNLARGYLFPKSGESHFHSWFYNMPRLSVQVSTKIKNRLTESYMV